MSKELICEDFERYYQIDNLIEASSENLKIMKDDAGKVDLDTIMLFLQLFSELSADIQYTKQKRVMIESLFVKLCKESRADNEYGKRLSILEEHSREQDFITSKNIVKSPSKPHIVLY